MASIPAGIVVNGKGVDLSPRFYSSATVVGSPALAAATNVCQITGIASDLAVMSGVYISAMAAFTVGTSGSAVTLKIRAGTTAGSGTTIFSSGAMTVSAGNLYCIDVQGVDTGVTGGGPPGSSSYFLEMTVTNGAAASTVSAASMIAYVV